MPPVRLSLVAKKLLSIHRALRRSPSFGSGASERSGSCLTGREPVPIALSAAALTIAKGCEGLYRVLYVGSAPYACYLETLARFRPDLSFYAELAEIDGPIDHVLPNVVDADWRDRRRLGTATAGGDHANVGHSVWLAAFRQHLACEIGV